MSNNEKLRELFTLPSIQTSPNTSLVAPKIPAQQVVTGDKEIDAVLWLQSIVKTGQQDLISKALTAAKEIKTPMKDLGRRYADHIARTTGNTLRAAFSSFGFGELENQAERAIERAALRLEAMSRFGSEDALFKEHPAERQCRLALKDLDDDRFGFYDDDDTRLGFEKRPSLVPGSIGDCLHVINFWNHIYKIRIAVEDGYCENTRESYAHENYTFFMLSEVPVRSKEEAVLVFDHIQESGKEEQKETPLILRHLINSGWSAKELTT